MLEVPGTPDGAPDPGHGKRAVLACTPTLPISSIISPPPRSGDDEGDPAQTECAAPGANARYTVDAATGDQHLTRAFKFAQQPLSGWIDLGGPDATFRVGGTTQAAWVISVQLAFDSPHQGDGCPAPTGCPLFAAAQGQFQLRRA